MPTSARVVTDSISESGIRLVTLVLEYPRIIHSEVMTHRMFSRNASSSRAIPVSNNITRVQTDGFTPSYLGKNEKGMQASSELLDWERDRALSTWEEAKENAVLSASLLSDYGVHKQLANRVLEPFNYIQLVVTATEWDNFFLQRLDKNAQPEIQELARVMKEAMDNSIPKLLKTGEWHLPFIEEGRKDIISHAAEKELTHKFNTLEVDLEILNHLAIKISVARCARVSYSLNERGWGDIEKDLALYDRLLLVDPENGVWHASPFEHQATPINEKDFDRQLESDLVYYAFHDQPGITHMDRELNAWSGNFKGWIQNRQLIQQSISN